MNRYEHAKAKQLSNRMSKDELALIALLYRGIEFGRDLNGEVQVLIDKTPVEYPAEAMEVDRLIKSGVVKAVEDGNLLATRYQLTDLGEGVYRKAPKSLASHATTVTLSKRGFDFIYPWDDE